MLDVQNPRGRDGSGFGYAMTRCAAGDKVWSLFQFYLCLDLKKGSTIEQVFLERNCLENVAFGSPKKRQKKQRTNLKSISTPSWPIQVGISIVISYYDIKLKWRNLFNQWFNVILNNILCRAVRKCEFWLW